MKIVFCTTPSVEEARRIATKLVESKLAACCNIVPNLRSIYVWDGKICDNEEALIIIKTADSEIDPITALIKEIHSYDLPEIIAIQVVDGSEDYINWVNTNSSGR